jgi:broad specificity phosphatase PhoE
VTTRLVLVRHGEARAGVEHFIGGHASCKGLTGRGRNQAERLRDRFARTAELSPDVVLASVLPRAIETAEIVGAALPTAEPLATECDYCEQHVGECDGLPWEEFSSRYGPFDAGDPDRPLSPGGESPREFDARVRRATTALLERYRDRSIMLFTHGGFVTAATLFLLGAPGIHEPGGVFRLQPKNTSLTVFVSDGPEAPWVLDRYNDVTHLADE